MKSSLLLIIAGVANAKTATAAPDPSIVDELKDCVLDVVNALLGGASDVLGYTLALPRFSADLAVWAIEFVRGLMSLFVIDDGAYAYHMTYNRWCPGRVAGHMGEAVLEGEARALALEPPEGPRGVRLRDRLPLDAVHATAARLLH
mgnify:CR=1 FL=1